MADLQILAGTSVTITETFSVDGAAINVDSGLPTLTLTKPDGTVYTPTPTVLNAWVGPPARAVGEYRFVLPAQPDPYYLDYKLVGTIGGQAQTFVGRVEWIGAFLFNESELRALRVAGGTPFATTATPLFTDADIHRVRAEILEEMAGILGLSPVPRFVRETHTVNSGGVVRLLQPEPTRLLSVSVAGVAQTVGNYTIGPGDTLAPVTGYTASGWTSTGVNNVTVEYVAGWPRPLGKGGRVAMMWAAAELQPSLYSTAQTVTTADGETYTYEPSETGRFGFQRYTGIKAVDKWLNLHGPKVGASA